MHALMINNRNFIIVWFGKLSILIGNRFSALVIPWIVLNQTGSPLKTGLVTICSQISPLLFSIPAGTYIERMNKKKVAAFSELIRGSTMLVLVAAAFLEMITLPVIMGVLLVTGFTGLTYRISFNAMIPSIAGRKNLMGAHNYIEGADAIGTLIGPVLAGVLFTHYGAGAALSVDAIVIFFSMVTLLFINENKLFTPLVHEDRKNKGKTPFFTQAKKGFQYIFSTRIQVILTLNHFTLNFTTVYIMLLVIIHGKEAMGLSVTETGLLITAAGIGNILAVVLTTRLRNVPWVSLLLVTISISAFGILLFASTTQFWLAFVGILLFDGALSMAFVVHGSTTQAVTDDHYLSRVSSSRYVISGSAALGGSFIAGVISEYWTSSIALMTGVVVLGLSAFITAFLKTNNKPVHELHPIEEVS